MPNLNEYLGGLFNSISTARVMSDLQTAKLAEQYAEHEILRHFSIPRMRIGDVELTIPIAIKGMSDRIEYQLSPVPNEKFKNEAYRVIVESIDLDELPLLASQALNSALISRTTKLAEALRAEFHEEQFKYFAIDSTEKFIEIGNQYGLFSSIKINKDRIITNIFQYAIGAVKEVVEKPVIDQLAVIGESHLLREQRPEDIVRIRMVVAESGMEWQTIDNGNGSTSRKLLPE